MRASFHSGPLPPADVFADYDRICPGAAREILDMAVRAQTHAHDMETRALKSEASYRVLGIVTAGLVIAVMIGGAVTCAIYGYENAAMALGAAAGLSSLAGVFVRGQGLFEARKAEPVPEEPLRKKGPVKRSNKQSGKN